MHSAEPSRDDPSESPTANLALARSMNSNQQNSSSAGSAVRDRGDHFSTQAADYATFRPHYPAELFAFLAGVVPRRELAWDCATGNGQAAVPLSRYFSHIVATDISAAQLRHAEPHERIEYRVARAHDSGLPTGSVDLVTVAQALHWLDLPAFYSEVERVLAPNGLLSVWSYGSASVDTDALTECVAHLEFDILGKHWPEGRALVGEALRDLPFPFEELESPVFTLNASWRLDQLVGYTRSWSATTRYVSERGRDPIPDFERELRAHWGDPASRHVVHWPFVLRVGRVRG